MAEAGPIRLSKVKAFSEADASPAPQPQSRSDHSAQPNQSDRQQPSTKPRKAKKNQRDFYLLSLHQNVRVQQGDQHSGWTAAADRLDITFSMQSKNLNDSVAAQLPLNAGAMLHPDRV